MYITIICVHNFLHKRKIKSLEISRSILRSNWHERQGEKIRQKDESTAHYETVNLERQITVKEVH